MSQTRAQLLERISVLEDLFSSHLLRPLREEIRELRSRVDALKKTLGEESAQKQHWEDCTKRLMLENEFLKKGKAGAVRDPAAPLEPRYMMPEPPIPWWRKLFSL